MTIKFKAKAIHAEKNQLDGYYMVGLANNKYDYTDYILLQKAFLFDEQDIKTGMDGHHFETKDQLYSAYKCCEKVILTKQSLTVFLRKGSIGDLSSVEIDITSVKLSAKYLLYLEEILGDILENNVFLSKN